VSSHLGTLSTLVSQLWSLVSLAGLCLQGPTAQLSTVGEIPVFRTTAQAARVLEACLFMNL
jgi:hypothetical protein